MKKIINFINKNKLIILAIIFTLLVIKGGVDAANAIEGTNVTYKDNYSLGATTVQAAVDKLCSKVSNIDTRVTNASTIDLLYNPTQALVATTTSGQYNYASISNMSNYSFIMYYVTVGNIGQYLVCTYGDSTPQILYDTPSDNNKVRGAFLCDWSNNRIGVTHYDATGTLNNNNVKLWKVYGFLKK